MREWEKDEGEREKEREQKAGLKTKRQVELARNLLAIGRVAYFAKDTRGDIRARGGEGKREGDEIQVQFS